MLWQRVVTALVLLLVLLPALFYPSAVPFSAVAMVFIAAGAWEWARLAGYGPGLALGSASPHLRLPLQDDAVLTSSRALPGLSGWLDAAGRAEATVTPALAERAPGEALWACLLLLNDPSAADVDALVAAVSEPVRLRF